MKRNDFSRFIKCIRPLQQNKERIEYFTNRIIEIYTPYVDEDKFADIKRSDSTIKKYAYGSDEISKEVASEILRYKDEDSLKEFIDDAKNSERSAMLDLFSSEFPDEGWNLRNIGIKVPKLLTKILVDASTKDNKKSTSKSAKNKVNLITNKEHFFDYINSEEFDDIFVETSIYKKVSAGLEKNNVVILIGQPGIGKTITSKRIAKDYELKGFQIYYSEEGNVDEVKSFIDETNPQDKTLIILNDFLGQFYTEQKFDQRSEINGLISSTRHNKNVKLLMNTRGIIYQEAIQDDKFSNAIFDNSNFIQEIPIKELNINDKALILHNHLKKAYQNGILSEEHYSYIKKDHAYANILFHKNFSPRIINHITSKRYLPKTSPSDYINLIMNILENPKDIWKNEYEKLNVLDRILLNSLFSLTNTNVPINVLEKSFNKRLENTDNDTTINHFHNSAYRLTESIINIIHTNNEQRIGIIDPSFNDFLFGYLKRNKSDLEKILKYSLFYEQIDKLIECGIEKAKLIEQIQQGLLEKLNTFSRQVFSDYELYFEPPKYLCILKILIIYLDEEELTQCGISKDDIQSYIKKIFEKDYENLFQYTKFHFAYEFSDLFARIIKSSQDYDLTEVMNVEKYFNIIIESIVKQDDFFEILNIIQKKYFPYNYEKFYKSKNIKTNIIKKIESEIVEDIYDNALTLIKSEIDNIYEDNNDDYSYIVDSIFENIEDDMHEWISDYIYEKLENHNITLITSDDFYIDDIVNNDIYNIIEEEINKKDYKNDEKIKEEVIDTIKLFEKPSWITIK